MHHREFLLDTFAHLRPAAALEALAEADAFQHLSRAPHSIAEIVAHMDFWQRWFIKRCEGTAEPMASEASVGWPDVPAGSWNSLREQFLSGLEIAVALDPHRPVEPPIEFPPFAHYTVEEALVHLATHNAHHLGQIITLRQLMGLWPPPAGSWTW